MILGVHVGCGYKFLNVLCKTLNIKKRWYVRVYQKKLGEGRRMLGKGVPCVYRGGLVKSVKIIHSDIQLCFSSCHYFSGNSYSTV